MINTYEKAKTFHHKQMGNYIILQDAYSIYAFEIIDYKNYEPNNITFIKSIDKMGNDDIDTYDKAYDALIGEISMPDFTKALRAI